MIIGIHLLVGAAIAQKLSNPILGFSFAFISHYFLDFLPHSQYDVKFIYQKIWHKSFFDFLKIILDISLAVLLIFIFSEKIFWALGGAFFTILPDFFSFLFLIFPKNGFLKKHYYFHVNKVNLHLNKKTPAFLGILIQLLIGFVAVLFLK